MEHLILGLPVASLAFPPCRPLFTEGKVVNTAELGWETSVDVCFFPLPGGFVGGDLVSPDLTPEVMQGVREVTDEDILLYAYTRFTACRFGLEATVRPSVGLYNVPEDVESLVAALNEIS